MELTSNPMHPKLEKSCQSKILTGIYEKMELEGLENDGRVRETEDAKHREKMGMMVVVWVDVCVSYIYIQSVHFTILPFNLHTTQVKVQGHKWKFL